MSTQTILILKNFSQTDVCVRLFGSDHKNVSVYIQVVMIKNNYVCDVK